MLARRDDAATANGHHCGEIAQQVERDRTAGSMQDGGGQSGQRQLEATGAIHSRRGGLSGSSCREMATARNHTAGAATTAGERPLTLQRGRGEGNARRGSEHPSVGSSTAHAAVASSDRAQCPKLARERMPHVCGLNRALSKPGPLTTPLQSMLHPHASDFVLERIAKATDLSE